MDKQEMLRCTIMRGGTSKAIIFKENELPSDPQLREELILNVFGSPDIKQVDGLGGASEGFSKVAIIGPSTSEDADIDYTFGQVGIDTASVNWNFNCGNISAAVGPYAIDECMVKVTEPFTEVRIHLTSSKQIITAKVPVKNGRAVIKGDYKIAGVPGTGARIDINSSGLVGSSTGKLLPTGNVVDALEVEGLGKIQVSIVDIANPLVFVHANTVGAKGTESRLDIMENKKLLNNLVAIRCAAAELLGFVDDRKNATALSPARPMLAFVREPIDYVDYTTNEIISEKDVDLVARNIFNNKAHETFTGTGSICTVVAALIEGTIVSQVVSDKAKESGIVRMGHPRGIIEVVAKVEKTELGYEVVEAMIGRTARRILDGYVYIKSPDSY